MHRDSELEKMILLPQLSSNKDLLKKPSAHVMFNDLDNLLDEAENIVNEESKEQLEPNKVGFTNMANEIV